MVRLGDVIRVPQEKIAEYVKVHDEIWPRIEELMRKANIENFTIFYRDGYLFKYYEYTGEDFAADMKILDDDEEHQRWIEYTKQFQIPVDTAAPDEWWAPMKEVYHLKEEAL